MISYPEFGWPGSHARRAGLTIAIVLMLAGSNVMASPPSPESTTAQQLLRSLQDSHRPDLATNENLAGAHIAEGIRVRSYPDLTPLYSAKTTV